MLTHRLFAILEYDGTDFQGFQVQERGRTVQGELEQALRQITGSDTRVVGGGRTDSGVHALGQTAHFDTDWDRSEQVLQRALNAVLPNDIAIRSLTQVGSDFSARYSATSRVYRYTILNQPIRSPLTRRYALAVAEPLNVAEMDRAARCLVGRHDLSAFGTPPRGENSVREIFRAEVERDGLRVQIELEANAFLYRMVRRTTGTLLGVGKGQVTVAEFKEVLAGKRRAGDSAPPQGLCLMAIKYDRGAAPAR